MSHSRTSVTFSSFIVAHTATVLFQPGAVGAALAGSFGMWLSQGVVKGSMLSARRRGPGGGGCSASNVSRSQPLAPCVLVPPAQLALLFAHVACVNADAA